MEQRVGSHHGAVVHHIPGRTRMRVARAHRNPATMAKLKETLQRVPGVQRVEVKQSAGSVIMHHDPDVTTLDDVAGSLEEDLGFFLDLVPPRERLRVQGEVSTVAHALHRGFAHLDDSVARATGGWVDLKMLVPVAFVGAAAVQVTVSEGAWTAVPPYVLLYYAFDTYTKFHLLAASRQPVPATQPASTAPAISESLPA